MDELDIAIADPRIDDVRGLVEHHLKFGRLHSPPQDAHALEVDGLLDPAVTVFSIRRRGELVAIGALKRLDDQHAELKTMHTAEHVRGQGVGRAMLDHLLAVARERGFQRVSLETGVQEAFAPARSLYVSAGFTQCEPFDDYRRSPNTTYMTMRVSGQAKCETARMNRVDRARAAAEDLKRAGGRDAQVEIVEYDSAWPARFAAERERIRSLLGGAEIHHFGSTAVPGLAAKPVIDMIALVGNLDAHIVALTTGGGYQFPQAFNATLAHRRFLCYPSASVRTYHLHLVDEPEELERRLRFRYRLRTDPVLAQEYVALKRTLAERFPDDREKYTDAKSEFIRRHEQSVPSPRQSTASPVPATPATIGMRLQNDALHADDASLLDLVEVVRALPYGRPTDRTVEGMLRERRGTCSTKHLFLARRLAERFPETEPQIVHRVYTLDRARARELFGAEVAAAVPEDGLVDVHRYLTVVLGGQRAQIDATFPGAAWDGHSPFPLACGPGEDHPAGDDPDAEKRALEEEHCDPTVREPFIAALTQADYGVDQSG